MCCSDCSALVGRSWPCPLALVYGAHASLAQAVPMSLLVVSASSAAALIPRLRQGGQVSSASDITHLPPDGHRQNRRRGQATYRYPGLDDTGRRIAGLGRGVTDAARTGGAGFRSLRPTLIEVHELGQARVGGGGQSQLHAPGGGHHRCG